LSGYRQHPVRGEFPVISGFPKLRPGRVVNNSFPAAAKWPGAAISRR